MKLEEVADSAAAALRSAEVIADACRDAVAERGEANIAVSGGRTPWQMLAHLSAMELPWDDVAMFQVDERIAPPGSQERNLTHIIAALPIERQAVVRPMPVTSRDLDAACRSYAESLPERFDLIHLGLGPDGHTASLVPGDSVLEVTDRRVALTGGLYQDTRRMTLTYPVLDDARRVLFLVTGEEKREPLAQLLDGDHAIPAGRVSASDMICVADADAAG